VGGIAHFPLQAYLWLSANLAERWCAVIPKAIVAKASNLRCLLDRVI
jgi:hypothetical protein